MSIIKPTVGRVVHFHMGSFSAAEIERSGPFAAIITHVWSDRLVNLMVFPKSGPPESRTSVTLRQDDQVAPEKGSYCEWMAYQVGQTKKTEEAEEKLAQAFVQPKPPLCEQAEKRAAALKTLAEMDALLVGADNPQWTKEQLAEIAETESHPLALPLIGVSSDAPRSSNSVRPFVPGDEVLIRLGGYQDQATVLNVDLNDRSVRCGWWHEGVIREVIVPPIVLKHA